ncbi:MAG: hypothetical protein AAF327_24040 [Cyanobacteria bacterium P01_A01_bin.37]
MKLPTQATGVTRNFSYSTLESLCGNGKVRPQGWTRVHGCWVCGSAPPGVDPPMCCRDFLMADVRVWASFNANNVLQSPVS